MRALLDGDIFAFRCASASEDTDEAICIARLDKLVQDTLYMVDSSTYNVFLTGSDNFRKTLYPEYKANRKDKPKPIHLQACREYLIKTWNAEVSEGCEADDMLGYTQDTESVIVSIDKDLLQIPGKHYNFVKNEWFDQNEWDGIRFFYHQLLKGDRSDNIPGVAGLGEKKAQRILEGCETEQELFDTCRDLYKDDTLMYVYGACLWIWRTKGGTWQPDNLIGNSRSSYVEVERSDSMMEKEED